MRDGKYEGLGDPTKLREILEIFKKWVENSTFVGRSDDLEEESKVSDYNYLSIKNSIINWYNEQFYNQDNVIISKDTGDILIIDFDFNECLAQLTISNANNNPFQFIYFEAVDIENGNNVYRFYDDINMNIREVINALIEAYKYCENYKMT